MDNCPKCGKPYTKKNRKSEYHIYPRRWFGDNDTKAELCRPCHDLLEELIRRMEKRLMQKNGFAFLKIYKLFMES